MSTETTLEPYLRIDGPITIATASGLARVCERFTTEFDEHADREGDPFTVVGMVEPRSYDFEEVGPLYRIQFGDGLEIDAYPEEVETAVTR